MADSNKKYRYAKAGDYGFYYKSIKISSGADYTQTVTVSNGYIRNYYGKKPVQILIVGSLAPSEKSYFSKMIKALSEKTFELDADNEKYSSCIMSYGEVSFSDSCVLGSFKLIFKEL